MRESVPCDRIAATCRPMMNTAAITAATICGREPRALRPDDAEHRDRQRDRERGRGRSIATTARRRPASQRMPPRRISTLMTETPAAPP